MVSWLLNSYILTDTSLLILFVLTAGIFLLAWLRTRLGGRRAAEPQCGACGYCVRGISSLTCPECGNNLRQVGIIATGRRLPRPLGPTGAVILWSIALPIPALLVSANLVRTIIPNVYTQFGRWTIDYYSDGLTKATLSLNTFRQDRTYWSATTATGALLAHHIDLTTDLAPNRWMHVDLLNRTYRYVDASGNETQKRGDFTEDTFLAWLAACGANPSLLSDPAIKTMYQAVTNPEAFRPTATRNALNSGSAVYAGAGSLGYSLTPASWAVVLLVALWLLVWLAGLAWIWHRHQARTTSALRSQSLQEQGTA